MQRTSSGRPSEVPPYPLEAGFGDAHPGAGVAETLLGMEAPALVGAGAARSAVSGEHPVSSSPAMADPISVRPDILRVSKTFPPKIVVSLEHHARAEEAMR